MVSIIIPIFCNMNAVTDHAYRLRNLIESLHCISNQTYKDLEIIVVEQYTHHPTLDHMFHNSDYVYLPIKHNEFNMSWCRNCGAKIANGDLLLHYASDEIVANDYIENLLKSYKCDYLFGWKHLISLGLKATEDYLMTREYRTNFNDDEIIAKCDVIAGSGCNGSPCLYDKDFYLSVIGGFNENFSSWGNEDCDIISRVSSVVGVDIFDHTILHLFHGTKLELPKKNIDMLEYTYKHPDHVTKQLLNSDIGNTSSPTIIQFNNPPYKEINVGVPYIFGRTYDYRDPSIDDVFINEMKSFDVIQCLDYYTPSVEACMVHDNVFVCINENIVNNPLYNGEPIKRVNDIIYKNARHFFAVSNSAKNALIDGGVSSDRITVVNFWGCDVKQFKPQQLTHDEKIKYLVSHNIHTNANNIVLFVGRITKCKGIDYLIEAVKDIDDCVTILVGEWLLENIGINDNKICDNIYHIPFIDKSKLNDIYNAGDILVLPSLHKEIWMEQFGRVLVEAMACELPVISTNIGGPLDIIDNGENGFLVPPANTRSIYDAIVTILHDKELSYKMGKNGRLKVLKQFSNNVTAEIMRECYANYRR